jgi:ABC-type Fe3+ transport system permease subunit
MDGVAVLACIILVITSSAAAPARKLAGDDGQQTAETQTKMKGNDWRPMSGVGDHHCPARMLPCCPPTLGKAAPKCRG